MKAQRWLRLHHECIGKAYFFQIATFFSISRGKHIVGAVGTIVSRIEYPHPLAVTGLSHQEGSPLGLELLLKLYQKKWK